MIVLSLSVIKLAFAKKHQDLSHHRSIIFYSLFGHLNNWHFELTSKIKQHLNTSPTYISSSAEDAAPISVLLDKDAVIMWRNSPVFRVVILVWIVFLVVGEESIELYALLEILNSLEASDVLEEIEVSVNVDASSDESVPVDAL